MSPQGPLQCRAKSLQPTLTQTKSQRVASIQSLLLDILGCLVALPKCADWLDGRSELQSQMASRCSCRKLHGATCVTNGSAPCQDESGHSGVVLTKGKSWPAGHRSATKQPGSINRKGVGVTSNLISASPNTNTSWDYTRNHHRKCTYVKGPLGLFGNIDDACWQLWISAIAKPEVCWSFQPAWSGLVDRWLRCSGFCFYVLLGWILPSFKNTSQPPDRMTTEQLGTSVVHYPC